MAKGRPAVVAVAAQFGHGRPAPDSVVQHSVPRAMAKGAKEQQQAVGELSGSSSKATHSELILHQEKRDFGTFYQIQQKLIGDIIILLVLRHS